MNRRAAESVPAGFAVRRVPKRSRTAGLLRAAAAAVVIAAIAVGGWWLWHSPTFSVSKIETGAYRFTDASELQTTLSGFMGHNLWALSIDEVTGAVESLPWIREVRATRSVPGTLQVEFEEYRPLLALAPDTDSSAATRVLVGDGRILEFPPHLTEPGLPVLVGVPAVPEGEDGPLAVPAEKRDDLLELISAMEDVGLESVLPVDFVVARPEGYAIVLQDMQASLMVGDRDFESRLERYMIAREHLDTGLEIDLRFDDRITVKKLADSR